MVANLFCEELNVMGKQFLIVDDHPLFLSALQAAISSAFPHSKIVSAKNVDEVEELLALSSQKFDLVIHDLRMPGKSGFDGVRAIKAVYPDLPVVMISRLQNKKVIEHAGAIGASAFLHKGSATDEIVAAIKAVVDGNTWFPKFADDDLESQLENDEIENKELMERIESLTPQQRKVLELICDGQLNKQIAHELNIGETTVKAHITALLQKLEVQTRTQAAMYAQKIRLHEANLITSTGDL
ncbi:MAG: response regulator transcription factor [Hyphomicrobiales bacterium]|nr:response regulator transcription factor [Hyphomicrobiales bacterium]